VLLVWYTIRMNLDHMGGTRSVDHWYPVYKILYCLPLLCLQYLHLVECFVVLCVIDVGMPEHFVEYVVSSCHLRHRYESRHGMIPWQLLRGVSRPPILDGNV